MSLSRSVDPEVNGSQGLNTSSPHITHLRPENVAGEHRATSGIPDAVMNDGKHIQTSFSFYKGRF